MLGPDHPQTVRSRLNLATAYARLDRATEALPLEAEVIAARTRSLGPTHPDTVSILVNHAGTLLRAGRARDALDLLADVQPLSLRVLGPKHPQAQLALLVTGEAWRASGQPGRAVAPFELLLAMRREASGEDSVETRTAAWNLRDALRESGRLRESDALQARYIAPLLDADPATLGEAEAGFVEDFRAGRRPGARG